MPALARRFARLLRHPVAPPFWDHVLWISGGASLAGIAAMGALPAASELAVFFSLSLLINGPYGSLLPTIYEPVVMVFARLHPPPVVALVGAGAATLVEYANYHLFRAVLHAPIATRLRESRLARQVTAWFGLQPFATITVCAVVPVPFWIVRGASTLARYPVGRHLAASGLGRFTRLTFYGYLATVLTLSDTTLLSLGAAITALLLLTMFVRARLRRGPGRPPLGDHTPPLSLPEGRSVPGVVGAPHPTGTGPTA